MDEPAPPTWVYKRDGRLVPFDADKISRALFAAAEGLGRADAFLARELADAVVHFLTAEGEGP
ncbi:MAG TPA: ATP cone domain-containing protein, partial [Gemmataceae bacterium]|nr:ATP cone domain-containing protein [Gemmataceae bacterium]